MAARKGRRNPALFPSNDLVLVKITGFVRSSRYGDLEAGDYQGACDQLVRWDKARVAGVMVSLPGLTKRRAKERDLCLSGAV